MDPDSLELVSQRTSDYNCAAWAIYDTTANWWPLPVEEAPEYVWPEGALRDDTIEALIDGFSRMDFQLCDTPDLEDGFEKIAFYATQGGTPQHVARQLENGRWTSKLGDEEDITHKSLRDLSAWRYGDPVRYMRRRRVEQEEARPEGG